MDHPCNMNLNNKSILRSTSGCYLSGVIFLSPPSSPCFPQHWSNFPRCPLVLKSTGRNGISIPGELLHWSCSPLSSHYMGPWTLQGHKPNISFVRLRSAQDSSDCRPPLTSLHFYPHSAFGLIISYLCHVFNYFKNILFKILCSSFLIFCCCDDWSTFIHGLEV